MTPRVWRKVMATARAQRRKFGAEGVRSLAGVRPSGELEVAFAGPMTITSRASAGLDEVFVVFGGCVISGDDPSHECIQCGTQVWPDGKTRADLTNRSLRDSLNERTFVVHPWSQQALRDGAAARPWLDLGPDQDIRNVGDEGVEPSASAV